MADTQDDHTEEQPNERPPVADAPPARPPKFCPLLSRPISVQSTMVVAPDGAGKAEHDILRVLCAEDQCMFWCRTPSPLSGEMVMACALPAMGVWSMRQYLRSLGPTHGKGKRKRRT